MSAQRGIARERALRKLLDAEGWWTCRAAGSFGDADIVAIRARGWGLGPQVRLIEVKSTAAGAYASFGPDKREALRAAAALAGVEAWLVWWPPRTDPMWLHESDWPVDKRQAAVVGS